MIQTDHNGYRITYSENADVWHCLELKLEAAKLSTLKSKINATLAQARKVESVPAFIAKNYQHHFEPCTIVSLDQGGEAAWVMVGKQRSKEALSDLVLDTPENREAMAAAQQLAKEAERAWDLSRKAREALPRATASQLGLAPATDATEAA